MLVMIIQFPIFISVWNALTGSASLSRDAVLGLRLSDTIWNVLTDFTAVHVPFFNETKRVFDSCMIDKQTIPRVLYTMYISPLIFLSNFLFFSLLSVVNYC